LAARLELGTFFFDPTGDTDAVAGENPFLQARGSYGAIFRVDLGGNVSGGEGQISLFLLGDHDHNSFDNLAFINQRQLLAAEDRGDLLHTQLNTLDSVWALDVEDPSAIRFIALGRDATSIAHGEDNEPTGVYVSNGRTQQSGLLGTKNSVANPRGFFTQQHGDNNTYEIFSVPASQVGSTPVPVQ
jgi:hypothetical protein